MTTKALADIKYVVESKHVYAFTRAQLLDLLRGKIQLDIPPDAEVFVDVPGGGDWSHTRLDIDAETPLMITWVTRTESE